MKLMFLFIGFAMIVGSVYMLLNIPKYVPTEIRFLFMMFPIMIAYVMLKKS